MPISGRVKTSSIASIGEADVGGVLLRRPVGRRQDHVDRRLGERDDVLRIAAPVGVGALDGDLALDDVGAEQGAELVAEVGADPHRDVVEVDEEGGVRGVQRRAVARPMLRGALGAWGPRWMSAAPERDGPFREVREFMRSLASPDAWCVSGAREAMPVLSLRGRARSQRRSAARRPRERQCAVRTFTGSPRRAERGSEGGTDHADTVIDLVTPVAAGECARASRRWPGA